MDWKRVHQFVAEKQSGLGECEIGESCHYTHLLTGEAIPQPLAKRSQWLNDAVVDVGSMRENVRRQLTIICALLNHRYPFFRLGVADPFCEQPPEALAHAHAGEKVTAAPDRGTAGGIVALFGVIKREFHESPEGDGRFRGGLDLFSNRVKQCWVGAHSLVAGAFILGLVF